ncbi:MAG TPA: sulfatase-like hydrolase/transferase [Acidimicrobiales bacterium]
MNVLFITLDQFRADSYGAAGHPLVATPTLDRLARGGVRLARHYSQAAPCSPGRAALYTGTYQMNNRVVANGSPLAHRFDNVARLARRGGYVPTLFGYTDQGLDPTQARGVDDPRLDSYDGVLPGFVLGHYLPESQATWVEYLRGLGYDVPFGWEPALRGESERPAEHSLTGFLTAKFLEWLDAQESGWFAHVSYLRPHPPYAAAGEYSTLYDPADVEMPISPVDASERHPLHEIALGVTASAAPREEEAMRHLRAQYYGMISEVDLHLGRIVQRLEQRGELNDTLIIVTSDHGDQLGDHGLIEKLGFFPQSYHILGLWCDPRSSDAGRVVDGFTENVDIAPTLADALGLEIPAQFDGRVLTPLLRGDAVEWRTSAHYEWDYRAFFISQVHESWPRDRSLSRQNLAVSVNNEIAYVQFGDGSYLCFDLANDPTWRTPCADLERVLGAAQEMLLWRQEHLSREFTDMLLGPERHGRWPQELRR